MVSLKEKYGEKAKFYFIEYNQEDAIPVIDKFNIQSHPQTFILDENDKVVYEMIGFDKITGEETLNNELEKILKAK